MFRARILECTDVSDAKALDRYLAGLKQVADSIKVNVVSTRAFVNLVRGDSEAVTWCMLVRPVVN